jgi:hypothetical protein
MKGERRDVCRNTVNRSIRANRTRTAERHEEREREVDAARRVGSRSVYEIDYFVFHSLMTFHRLIDDESHGRRQSE